MHAVAARPDSYATPALQEILRHTQEGFGADHRFKAHEPLRRMKSTRETSGANWSSTHGTRSAIAPRCASENSTARASYTGTKLHANSRAAASTAVRALIRWVDP